MVVMTAKVNKKKIAIVAVAVVALIVLICVLAGGKDSKVPTEQPTSISTNDGRVKFLSDFGWEVTPAPVETQQVKIPAETTEVYDRYNALQMSQGFDLTQYAGKTATRYVYEIRNYPEATDPVYATLLIYKDQVIGGDITNTSASGVVQGFQMPG